MSVRGPDGEGPSFGPSTPTHVHPHINYNAASGPDVGRFALVVPCYLASKIGFALIIHICVIYLQLYSVFHIKWYI